MSEKILSVFIDESGDFGKYESHSPFYIVSVVLHDQSINITDNINALEQHLGNLDYPRHAIHTGPLIRREPNYTNDAIPRRKQLFNALFNFVRRLDVYWFCVHINKRECSDTISATARLARLISSLIQKHGAFFSEFERLIIYYDNGQMELTRILTSVFSSLFSSVEFRKVQPVDYKLFQAADLICTMELLSLKAETNSFSRSEIDFFNSIRDFKKNYLKPLRKKRFS